MSPSFHKQRRLCDVTWRRKHSGNVLIVSLLIVLTITLMGVGLVHVANSQTDVTSTQANRIISLSGAESCIEEAREWLEGRLATGLPTIAQSFSKPNLNQPGDDSRTGQKLMTIKYACTLTPLGTGGAAGTSGIGAEVGKGGGYDGGGGARTYYFRIGASASQSGVTLTTIEAVLSVKQ